MTDLFPILPKLGELLKVGMKLAEDLVDGDNCVAIDPVVRGLTEASKDWHPKVRGVDVLADEGTRKAGIRFLAGIAVTAAGFKIKR